jgi:uncharacterized protein (TIGR02757 family)
MTNLDFSLKKKLDFWYAKANKEAFIEGDPVRFPRLYSERADQEIAAFLAATIAWGKRELILRSAEGMFTLMGKSPYAFVMSASFKKLTAQSGNPSGRRVIPRTFFEDDLVYFCRGFRSCYKKYGSLEALFVKGKEQSEEKRLKGDAGGMQGKGIWDGIGLFRKEMAAANGDVFSKHIADPEASSPCKRINLALRWLVRRDSVIDLGIWDKISPGDLYIPLDLHVGRSARQLGLLQRKANDRSSAIELTKKLKRLCPEDPVKYDLALFSMSIEGQAKV